MSRPSIDQLQQALKLTAQIQKLETELAAILGHSSAPKGKRAYTKRATSDDTDAPVNKKRKRSKISPEGLANIRAAQKRRWAKVKKEKAKA